MLAKPRVGEHALDHRRQQAHLIVGGLALLVVLRAMRDVALERGPQHQRAAGLVEGADGQQRAAHVRMHDDRIGRLVGIFRAGERAALQALLRVDARRSDRRPPTCASPCTPTPSRASFIIVNMALQAAVLLADQPAGRAVVVHHAGGVAVDAHLLLDRAAATRRCARRASRRR